MVLHTQIKLIKGQLKELQGKMLWLIYYSKPLCDLSCLYISGSFIYRICIRITSWDPEFCTSRQKLNDVFICACIDLELLVQL